MKGFTKGFFTGILSIICAIAFVIMIEGKLPNYHEFFEKTTHMGYYISVSGKQVVVLNHIAFIHQSNRSHAYVAKIKDLSINGKDMTFTLYCNNTDQEAKMFVYGNKRFELYDGDELELVGLKNNIRIR